MTLAGDTQQLQAVENGGGMSLLGDAQLTEPVRFRAAWEQAASLRLRAGDTAVLAEYGQHGRIYGGDPEQMMAADHALRRELSRRARGKHRRRRRGQSGGPDHLHPQRPRCPGGGARPDPG